ncbi:MAG: hypothetical protein MI810_13135 [Flavobacteriales bacterium]|nr:hypothetical protein [Flavobacteriales bacterium]
MSRFLFISLSAAFFTLMSCEKCKRCSYTYTETTIIQTPNGEEEQTVEKSGILNDDDGAAFGEECIKRDESFTIEDFYEAAKAESTLDNFDYECVDV